ncbi:NYN domain-containing protein [Heliorestis acidaminivorans]|uniref:NYN domain-containing protein n=1 Tax=Heliorestis acidaminivorans TaxID=553427 RepID=A0A6I0ERT7_9FIRM|nr:NYN domain-containing protein [Heliorestis acidaminivorans]KAB2951431.1 NYN domain-containing protein [Heliorestis acidaminivorans]
MQDILIVDGYNVLNAWPDLKELKQQSFEHAREKLIDLLAEYGSLQGLEVIIVFDAHLVKGGVERLEKVVGIKVVYTKEDETADRYIERLLGKYSSRRNIWVATGDAVEQSMALGRGACRVTVRELYHQVKKSSKDRKKHYRPPVEENHLDGRLSDEIRRQLERMRREKW